MCRRYAIILYSKEERPGAVEEAEDMQQSLEAVGFQVIMYEWSDTNEIIHQLRDILPRIMANCSLLTVCTMSHGYRGVLTDRQGNKLPINRIFNILSTSLPSYIPLVSTITIRVYLMFGLFYSLLCVYLCQTLRLKVDLSYCSHFFLFLETTPMNTGS